MAKIILILMVRNEARIIERSLINALPICDAVCITDTGSSDDTIEKIENFFTNKKIPYILHKDKWMNFGFNRSRSFENALNFCKEMNWNLPDSYGLLLDADLILKISNGFNKSGIQKFSEYFFIHRYHDLKFPNTRLIRMDLEWKCVGVTHEYWTNDQLQLTSVLPEDSIYIEDVGDGGCKDDKLIRDVSLLLKGLESEPNNERYMFYLAMTYKSLEDYDRAIKCCKKRIEMGGYEDEVWYCHYTLASIYSSLNDPIETEKWGNLAFNLKPTRLEPIYLLIVFFRKREEYFKAMHYLLIGRNISLPEDEFMLVEHELYEKQKIDFEYTIIHYYIYPQQRLEGLKLCVDYINKKYNEIDLVLNNTQYYMPRLLDFGTKIDLNLKSYEDFFPSSISLLEEGDDILANVRYINYRLIDNDSYEMKENGVWGIHNPIRTKNVFLRFNKNFNIKQNFNFLKENFDPQLQNNDVEIFGLEDLRLFKSENKLKGLSTSVEYSYNYTNSMVICDYDTESQSLSNLRIIKSPNLTKCEKNWIPIEDKFIYQWYPLEIGEIINNTLHIISSKETPEYFKYLRGSSNFYEYENEYWFIVHGLVSSEQGYRKYFHNIVVLDKQLRLKRYTVPFYFDILDVEYSLGLVIKDDILFAAVSFRDSNPSIVKLNLSDLKKLFVN